MHDIQLTPFITLGLLVGPSFIALGAFGARLYKTM